MEGKKINELLRETDTENASVFKDNEVYSLCEIPSVKVDKKILLTKLRNKYGEEIGNYIITRMFKDETLKVDPTKITLVFDNFMNKQKK